MARSKADFMLERFKHRLVEWDREFSLSMNKADAEIFLAAARSLIKARIDADEDPFN